MNYEEVLEWIHGQIKFGIKPGVARMTWILERMNNPQNNIFGLHVVGTNGKGSTVNNIQNILTASGYQVGTFTSPYIMDFRERIAINGRMISKEDLITCAEHVKPFTEQLLEETNYGNVTEFEIITLMMFVYFGQIHPVDMVIVEAGLGGLYDSTNVFKAFAVICPSIGLDHQNILGDSYQDIATHKAGVIKGGEHVIFAIDHPGARQVFLEKAKTLNALIYEYKKDFDLVAENHHLTFKYQTVAQPGIELVMPGQHQVSNAALSIMACHLLKEKFQKITDDSIKKGLLHAQWLGRTELLADDLMIDGAHNRESVQALCQVMKESYTDKNIHILFGAIDTKPVNDMLEMLMEIGDLEVTTFHYPNAIKLEAYPDNLIKNEDFQEWLAKRQQKENDFYLITGSLYFISEVRQFWKEQNN